MSEWEIRFEDCIRTRGRIGACHRPTKGAAVAAHDRLRRLSRESYAYRAKGNGDTVCILIQQNTEDYQYGFGGGARMQSRATTRRGRNRLFAPSQPGPLSDRLRENLRLVDRQLTVDSGSCTGANETFVLQWGAPHASLTWPGGID